MSLRLSIDEALAKGLITQADAKQMKAANKSGKSALEKRASTTTRSATKRAVSGPGSPQKILYDELCLRLQGLPQWEAEGLIPGRKFRADIFIPPSLVVEMDGFQYHRSKTAFQQDRMRQNLFVANGFKIIRVFAAQIFNAESRAEVIEQICTAAGVLEPTHDDQYIPMDEFGHGL